MDRRRVSVVVPAYNAERFLSEALESARSQSHPPGELIVVDDGSTDATAQIAAGHGVRLIRQLNAGQAAARNRGWRAATGEYVAFLDADDVWRSDKLERQLELLGTQPGLNFVYCDVEQIDEAGRPLGRRPASRRGRIWKDILLGQPIGGLCGSTPLVSRRRLHELAGFDEALSPCEDTDLFWRAAVDEDVDFVGQPLVRHRLHAANAHRDRGLMSVAWVRLYRKALADPRVAGLGPLFRARCRGRLHYVLAGEAARGGHWAAAVPAALRAVMSWPPQALRMANALRRRS